MNLLQKVLHLQAENRLPDALLIFAILISAPSALIAQEETASGNGQKEIIRKAPDTQKTKQLRMLRSELDKAAWNHYIYAREMAADGNRQRAASLFEEFLIVFPGHELEFSVLMELSAILLRENRALYAAELFMRAFELRKDSEEGWKAFLEAGRIYAAAGEVQKAGEIYRNLISQQKYPHLAETARNESNSLPFLDLKEASGETGLQGSR